MKTLEWRFIDKANWGDGPWLTEPDKAQWVDSSTGFPCLAVRHPSLGHWCGYVGVSEDHPAFGEDYYAVTASVHGGLTFADYCQEKDKLTGICHLPEPGEPERLFWLGFDCAHWGDLSPGIKKMGIRHDLHPGDHYRTLEYVKSECAQLAIQLKEMIHDSALSAPHARY